ncbi:MAG: type II toxin-antitoxin system RelE/ParE family toxin [Desulfuromonadales bacterium]
MQKPLHDWLDDRIEECKNPRNFGEPLQGELYPLWRYRIGNHRIIYRIQDERLVVLVLALRHHREISNRSQ